VNIDSNDRSFEGWLEDVGRYLSSVGCLYEQGVPNATMAMQSIVEAVEGAGRAHASFQVVALVPGDPSEMDIQDLNLLKAILTNGIKCKEGDYTICSSKELDAHSGQGSRIIVSFGAIVSETIGFPLLSAPLLHEIRADGQIKKEFWARLQLFVNTHRSEQQSGDSA
jgi:hypothetical protein